MFDRRHIPAMKHTAALHIFARTLALTALSLALDSCHRGSEDIIQKDLPTIAVQAIKVESIPHPATEEVVGTVRPKLRARIEAKLNSRIEEVFVAPGQTVTQGVPLATLDAREVQARLDQARAMLSQADKDFQRLQPLLQSNAISRQDFDASDAKLRVAKSAVTEGEAMLTHTKITAPFDGIITRKLADVGDLAMPGKPLFEIESPTTLRFEADLPEALMERVQMGQTLGVRLNSLSQTITGTVAEIAPIADPGSRTFMVKLDLPQVQGIRAGQFGRMKVIVGESTVPLVPNSAVTQRGQMELVHVVKNARASLRIVKTGKHLLDRVEIISGLEAGEFVIVGGDAVVHEGQPVEIKP